MLSTKTIALASAAGLLSVLAAGAATASAASDCAAGFCGRQVSETSPALALADDGSGFHRVDAIANLTTGASIYDWKPAGGSFVCPAGTDGGPKVAIWDQAKDAGISNLVLTRTNSTQIYNKPGSIGHLTADQVLCHDYTTDGWLFVSAPNQEIQTLGNGRDVTLAPAADATALDFRGVS